MTSASRDAAASDEDAKTERKSRRHPLQTTGSRGKQPQERPRTHRHPSPRAHPTPHDRLRRSVMGTRQRTAEWRNRRGPFCPLRRMWKAQKDATARWARGTLDFGRVGLRRLHERQRRSRHRRCAALFHCQSTAGKSGPDGSQGRGHRDDDPSTELSCGRWRVDAKVSLASWYDFQHVFTS